MFQLRTYAALTAVLFASSAAFAELGGTCDPEPVMQTGDFNGNGYIDSGDIEMISAYIEEGDYAAFFDMNTDGVLNGADVSIVAKQLGEQATVRDVQMATLWATTEPYRNIYVAYGAGYVPFTPDLRGHGIHFANFDLINSWGSRRFQAGAPEGLNYTAEGKLVAAFYFAPAAIDIADDGQTYLTLNPPDGFYGSMPHAWHHHVGACFGGTSCPVVGFDQCMDEATCESIGGQLWSSKFHMLHVWMFELNACGPFAGIDSDISPDAPHEPNHGACNIADVVPVALKPEPDFTPIVPLGFMPNTCYGN